MPSQFKEKLALQLAGAVDAPILITQPLSEDDWLAVAHLREHRYREYVSAFVAYDGPEPADYSPTVRTLIARNTETGELLGTLRYRDTTLGRDTCEWPAKWLPDALTEVGTYAFAERLVLERHPMSALAKLMLFKAWGLLAEHHGVTFMACQARPVTERLYRKMGFAEPELMDVVDYEIPGFIGVPNRLLVLPTRRARPSISAVMGPSFVAFDHEGLSNLDRIVPNRETDVFARTYLHTRPTPRPPSASPASAQMTADTREAA
jgi:hypothetical protein